MFVDVLRIPQEKPKEKTVFNVKLESFDAGSKPKVIREVKALVPNLTLMDVRIMIPFRYRCLTFVIISRPRSLWNPYPKF